MSFAITTDVVCDYPECGVWLEGVSGSKPLRRNARHKAYILGWRFRDGMDLCPEHVGEVPR